MSNIQNICDMALYNFWESIFKNRLNGFGKQGTIGDDNVMKFTWNDFFMSYNYEYRIICIMLHIEFLLFLLTINNNLPLSIYISFLIKTMVQNFIDFFLFNNLLSHIFIHKFTCFPNLVAYKTTGFIKGEYIWPINICFPLIWDLSPGQLRTSVQSTTSSACLAWLARHTDTWDRWECVSQMRFLVRADLFKGSVSLLQPTSNSVELCRNYEYI